MSTQIGLQKPPGSYLCRAGWNPAETGLYIVLSVRAVQAAQNSETEGCQPAPVAALARMHLLASGMELPAVSERLGHSSVLVTATVYSHRITGRDKEAAKKWDEFQRSHGSQVSGVVSQWSPESSLGPELVDTDSLPLFSLLGG